MKNFGKNALFLEIFNNSPKFGFIYFLAVLYLAAN